MFLSTKINKLKLNSYFSKNIENIRIYFCFLFLSALMARMINFYNLLPTAIDSMIFSIIAIIGFFITILNIYYKKFEGQDKILILFWIAILISSLVNIKYGIFNNLKELIWRAINFFLIFPYRKNNDYLITKVKKIIVIFCFIVSTISIITYIFQINYSIAIMPLNSDMRVDPFRFGFIENRLFGLYSNPNTASTTAFLSILFSFETFFLNKSKYYKFNLACIIIQFLYIILSGSRVTFVTMIIILFFIVWAILQNKNNSEKYFLSIISCIFLSILFCIGFYFFIKILKEILSFIPSFFNFATDMIETNNHRINMNRIDVTSSKDVSNLRFSIWLSGFEIFKTSWLFGVSPRNIVTYSEHILPNTFIAKTKYVSIHNTYIGVFVYTGIFGALFYFSFLIKKALKIFKNLVDFIKNINSINVKNIIMVLSLISIFIFGIFEPDITFLNTVVTFIFWIYIGQIF